MTHDILRDSQLVEQVLVDAAMIVSLYDLLGAQAQMDEGDTLSLSSSVMAASLFVYMQAVKQSIQALTGPDIFDVLEAKILEDTAIQMKRLEEGGEKPVAKPTPHLYASGPSRLQ